MPLDSPTPLRTLRRQAETAARRFLPFAEARLIVRRQSLKSWHEWSFWSKTKRPANIPATPYRTYRGDFAGIQDFCGYSRTKARDADWRTSPAAQQATFDNPTRAPFFQGAETAYTCLVRELEQRRPQMRISRAPYNTRATLFYRFVPHETTEQADEDVADGDGWLPLHVSSASLRPEKSSYHFRLQTQGFGLPSAIYTVFFALEDRVAAVPSSEHVAKRLTSQRLYASVVVKRKDLLQMHSFERVAEELENSWKCCAHMARPIVEWLPQLVTGAHSYKRARYELLQSLYRLVYQPAGYSLRAAPYTRHGCDFLLNGKSVLHRVMRLDNRKHFQWRVGFGKFVGGRTEIFPFTEDEAPEFAVVYDCGAKRDLLIERENICLRGVWILPRNEFQHCLAVPDDLSTGCTALNLYPAEYEPVVVHRKEAQRKQRLYYIDLSTTAARADAWRKAKRIFENGDPAVPLRRRRGSDWEVL